MSPKLIILAEDDTNLRQSIALVLQRAGYLITSTDCAQNASELIKSGNYQLIILDINMPNAGDILLPKVMSIYPYLSLIVLTDQQHPEIDEEKLLSAFYLVKPVAPERLLDCVGMVMARDGNNGHM